MSSWRNKVLHRLANPRNAASGSFENERSKRSWKKKLEAFFIHISYYTTIQMVKIAAKRRALHTHAGVT